MVSKTPLKQLLLSFNHLWSQKQESIAEVGWQRVRENRKSFMPRNAQTLSWVSLLFCGILPLTENIPRICLQCFLSSLSWYFREMNFVLASIWELGFWNQLLLVSVHILLQRKEQEIYTMWSLPFKHCYLQSIIFQWWWQKAELLSFYQQWFWSHNSNSSLNCTSWLMGIYECRRTVVLPQIGEKDTRM